MNAVRLCALASLLALSACASRTTEKVGSAAATPLTDLNLMRTEIPEVLDAALKQPYRPPAEAGCTAIVTEVRALNDALGADLDTPASSNEPTLLERGTDAAENTAVGALQRTAEGLIPFRSWVRKLSGAERHSRKVAAAITAGSIRRAFLKGVSNARGCVWQTSPPQLTASSSQVDPLPATASPAEAALTPKAEPASSPR